MEENDNVLILSINNLVGGEYRTYNTIRIFENDLEILKFSDNYYIYSYTNVKNDFQKNEVKVLRNKINDEPDLRYEGKSKVSFYIFF